MPKLLHIDCSPRAASASSRLAALFVTRWLQQNHFGTVVHRNTSLETIPYLNQTVAEALLTSADKRNPEQNRALAYSDRLVDELLAADVIVFGVPMWNLSIPASLKAWIDLIVREGRTFAFKAQGVEPLVPQGKRVYVFSTRGGSYSLDSPLHALDYQQPYLRTILGVIGLTEIEFIHAERQSESPEAAAECLARAERALEALATS